MRVPLDLPPGIDSNDTPYAASGFWADCDKVRFWQRHAQPIGGWEKLVGDQMDGVCRSVLPWSDTTASSALNVAFGTNTKLYVWVGGELYDITPSSGFTAGAADGTGGAGYGSGAYSVGNYSEPSTDAFFPLTWSLSNWGGNLIANPRGQGIFGWDNDTGTPAAALTNAPANVTYALVAPQDQVFALGCNEESGGSFNPLCIRHSSVRDNTVWNTAPDTTAREYVLPGGGRIVAGRVMSNYLLVWTNHSLFLGTYIGSLEQPWRFDKVADRCGLLAPNAAIVVGQKVFWLGSDYQFYTYSLGGTVLPVTCPILTDFVDNIAGSQFDKIIASSISKFSEIRFDYPDARDGIENSRYVALVVADGDAGSWSRGTLARTAFVDAGPSDFPIGVDPDGYAYWHERGHTADGGAFSWYVETADTYLDENNITFCRQLWPDIKDQVGPVSVTFTTTLWPQDPEPRTFGPYALAPSDRRLDFRASGRLIRTKFSGSSAPTNARIGKFVFDLVAGGRR